MMVKDVEGLYFIGEVVDVTGWLGSWASSVIKLHPCTMEILTLQA